MTVERIEVLAGTVDGVNRVFTTAFAYEAGSVRVFVRGLLRRQGDADGWTETSPAAGTITLAVAPLTGETVQAYYIDPTTLFAVSVIDGAGELAATSLDATLEQGTASGAARTVRVTGAVDGLVATARLRGTTMRGTIT